jgi:hypothetical protein
VDLLLNLRPGGPRPRYRGVFGLWLALATVPAAAQISPLSSQTLFYQQAARPQTGNYLAANGGLLYTNNVERTANGSNDTLLMLGLTGDTSREGSRLDYHLSSNLALLKYFSGTFPTRPTGYLDGLAALKIMPGFFSWIVRETFSQVQINPYAPVTPDNLVSLNNITTGPRFTLRPTLRTTVTLDGLYSYLSTSSPSPQYSSFDNHRYGGDLRISRAFSEAASLYLKGHYERAEFKDQVDNHNYSLADGLAGYKLVDGRTVFDVSGGYSEVHLYDVLTTIEGVGGGRESLETQKFNEPIWIVNISRLMTPSQRLALTASQQVTDAASAFRLGFDQPVPSIAPPQLATSNVFRQRLFGVDWRFQAARTALDISLTENQQRYLLATATAYNSDSKSANAFLARELSPVLKWDIGVTFQRQDQVGTQPNGVVPQSSRVWGAITDLQWQVGERLAMRFIYAHSSQSGVYSDNQVGVIASWALIAAQANAAQPYPGLAPIAPASTLSP